MEDSCRAWPDKDQHRYETESHQNDKHGQDLLEKLIFSIVSDGTNILAGSGDEGVIYLISSVGAKGIEHLFRDRIVGADRENRNPDRLISRLGIR